VHVAQAGALWHVTSIEYPQNALKTQREINMADWDPAAKKAWAAFMKTDKNPMNSVEMQALHDKISHWADQITVNTTEHFKKTFLITGTQVIRGAAGGNHSVKVTAKSGQVTSVVFT
jgi:hypothetical protein